MYEMLKIPTATRLHGSDIMELHGSYLTNHFNNTINPLATKNVLFSFHSQNLHNYLFIDQTHRECLEGVSSNFAFLLPCCFLGMCVIFVVVVIYTLRTGST